MKTKERNSSPTRAHHVALGQVNKSGLEMLLTPYRLAQFCIRACVWFVAQLGNHLIGISMYFAISHPNATLVSQIWNIFNGF